MPRRAPAHSGRAYPPPRRHGPKARERSPGSKGPRIPARTLPGSREPRDIFVNKACASVLLPSEHVTGAAHGKNAARFLRVVLDRGPDARDMDVDRTVESLQRLAPDEIHQALSR